MTESVSNGPAIVSAAFLGLSARPDAYYVRPARDMLRQSPLPMYVYTQPEHAHYFGGAARAADPMKMADEFWTPGWEPIYRRLIAENPTHRASRQAHHPQVVSAWLSKFEVLKHAFSTTSHSALLWWDAGLPISWHLGHRDEDYDGFSLGTGFADFLRKQSDLLIATTGTALHMPSSWMLDYVPFEPSVHHPAQLMLIQRRSFFDLYTGVRYWWQRLIADRKAGTEENALTLYAWHNGMPAISYEDWIRHLGLIVAVKDSGR